MTCASCVRKVERALAGVEDVDDAIVNLASRTAVVLVGNAVRLRRFRRARNTARGLVVTLDEGVPARTIAGRN